MVALVYLREHGPNLVLLDGTLAKRDRGGDGRADYPHKHPRRGMNVQLASIPLHSERTGSQAWCARASLRLAGSLGSYWLRRFRVRLGCRG